MAFQLFFSPNSFQLSRSSCKLAFLTSLLLYCASYSPARILDPQCILNMWRVRWYGLTETGTTVRNSRAMCLFKRFIFDFKEMHALASVVPPGSYLLEKKKKESLWLQSARCVAYKASLISSVTAKKRLTSTGWQKPSQILVCVWGDFNYDS